MPKAPPRTNPQPNEELDSATPVTVSEPSSDNNGKKNGKPRNGSAKKTAAPPPTDNTEPTSAQTKKARTYLAPAIPISGREIVFEKPDVIRSVLDAETCKKFLGWQEEPKDGSVKFADKYLLKDNRGVKVRCFHNTTNRPLRMPHVERLKQDILRRKYKFNGQPVIRGITGMLLDGQHTCLAVILAHQEWEDNQDKWKGYWTEPPYIQKVVVRGVSEDDDTVNTMDTGLGRTLADVLYRSPYFAAKPEKIRVKIAGVADHAIRLMWDRAGADRNAYSPLRTHSESLEFIERHPKLVDAITYTYELNGEKKDISRYIGPGYAAALLYLQAACLTEPSKPDYTGYRDVAHPTEALLDLSSWGKAQDFWAAVSERDKVLLPMFEAFEQVFEQGLSFVSVRKALIIKAWNSYVGGVKLTPKRIELGWAKDEDGIKHLAECPTVGGIDVGEGADEEEEGGE